MSNKEPYFDNINEVNLAFMAINIFVISIVMIVSLIICLRYIIVGKQRAPLIIMFYIFAFPFLISLGMTLIMQPKQIETYDGCNYLQVMYTAEPYTVS